MKRTIFRLIAAFTFVAVLCGTAGCRSATENKRIGLQLYSLRDAMGKDPANTLRFVAETGYTELETAHYDGSTIYGYSPREFRELVEGLGMKVTSCHIGMGWDPARETEIMAWWEKAFDDHKTAGCKYVIIPGVAIEYTVEWARSYCAYLDRLASKARAKGLKFGYHNHNAELLPLDNGQLLYDYMLGHTSDEVVFEMDVAWVKEAGYDPVEYLTKYPGRFPLLHIRDKSVIGESGEMDFEAIFGAAYAQGMEDFYVEIDKYTDTPEACALKSIGFLNSAPYVR